MWPGGAAAGCGSCGRPVQRLIVIITSERQILLAEPAALSDNDLVMGANQFSSTRELSG